MVVLQTAMGKGQFCAEPTARNSAKSSATDSKTNSAMLSPKGVGEDLGPALHDPWLAWATHYQPGKPPAMDSALRGHGHAHLQHLLRHVEEQVLDHLAGRSETSMKSTLLSQEKEDWQ